MGLLPYLAVLAFVVFTWMYLRRSIRPVAASGWRRERVAAGDCPKEHCGGKTYLVACEGPATLWRCEHCRSTYLVSSVPGE